VLPPAPKASGEVGLEAVRQSDEVLVRKTPRLLAGPQHLTCDGPNSWLTEHCSVCREQSRSVEDDTSRRAGKRVVNRQLCLIHEFRKAHLEGAEERILILDQR